MLLCKRVLYTGRVQGVGFRWTTHQLAQGLAVAGHVKNLPTGQVELVAEAEEAVLDELLRQVAEHFAGNITEADVHAEPIQQRAGFQVRH